MPVTADSTLWAADTHCVTADGRVVCVDADIHEAAAALDQLDAVKVAVPIPADVAEAAAATDLADAVSDVSADAIEPANALDETDAAIGANVLFGTVDEAVAALDLLDATVEAATVPIDGGGAYYPPQQRPFPVVGRGYGVLPQIEGEAHGVVGAVGKSTAQLVVRATAVGACGQAGNAAAVIKGLSISARGAIGARGSGTGVIMKFSGSATGRHDDDEAAVLAFLLAA